MQRGQCGYLSCSQSGDLSHFERGECVVVPTAYVGCFEGGDVRVAPVIKAEVLHVLSCERIVGRIPRIPLRNILSKQAAQRAFLGCGWVGRQQHSHLQGLKVCEERGKLRRGHRSQSLQFQKRTEAHVRKLAKYGETFRRYRRDLRRSQGV